MEDRMTEADMFRTLALPPPQSKWLKRDDENWATHRARIQHEMSPGMKKNESEPSALADFFGLGRTGASNAG
jgi:hypothetical protein